MKKSVCLAAFTIAFIHLSFLCIAQTSWRGTTSVDWATAANWTAGVPVATVDAIIGDASFTGPYQPTIGATATCKSLTIGGTVASTLTLNRNITASGNITINTNGSLVNGAASITLTGNWTNSGSYTTNSTSAIVLFAGTTQTLGGTNVTMFRRLRINTGSTVTLLNNVVSSGSSSYLQVRGTLNPNQSPAYNVNAASVTLYSNAVLKVTTPSFTGNYTFAALVLSAGSIVDYASTTGTQTVSSDHSYSTLRISGSGTKVLAANLPALRATASSYGIIQVQAGVFDLGVYTANRGTTYAGGTISVSNDATLRIGGTNSFPSNYTSTSLGLTSTVEYYGGAQTVVAKTYGNLLLSSTSGVAVKTAPTTAFTIAGNLTADAGTGTGISFTASAAISVTGNVAIGSGSTFNGGTGSFTHNITGNLLNNGTLAGNTSTLVLKGANAMLTGNGVHNFNNLTITGSGTTANTSTDLTIAGNLATSGSGTFQQAAPGTTVFSGTTKTISGTGIVLNDLSISGTVSTTSSVTVQGNFSVNGSFTATSGTISLTGSGKSLTGSGTIAFATLAVPGTVTTTTSFNIASGLNVAGTFNASAGTATFTGSATVTGKPNLFNVTENGSSLILASNTVLGISGALTITAGTVNTTSSVPNTIHYNGAAQTVRNITYNNLMVSNGSTKTAAGNTTVNNVFTIGTGTSFAAGSYIYSLFGNLVNDGTFSAGTSTVQFNGATNTTINGATAFNVLTVSKSSTANTLSLLSNITAATVNMTTGSLLTGSNGVTITGTRTGNGIILGSITRTHAFITGTGYAFESPFNTITFSAVSGVTSVTVFVAVASVADFPFGGAINRYYTIAVPAGTYTATLRLHYEDAELSGNDETLMQLWRYNGTAWTASGKTTNSSTDNWVEKTGITNLTNRWTCTDNGTVLRWNGSVSNDWNNAANWTPVQGSLTTAPTSYDIAEIGTGAFTNQPVISTAAVAKSVYFGSVQAVNLTINSGGSLITSGNISGTWTTNQLHNISNGAQSLTVNGDLILSDGTVGNAINLSIGTGTITVSGSVKQSGNAAVTFSGAGILKIGKDYERAAGTFTSGIGTVQYNGPTVQTVAGLSYYNLSIAKTAGIAELYTSATVGGNLSIASGEMDLQDNIRITGSVSISSTGILDANDKTIEVGKDWTSTGTFSAGAGTVLFNGTTAQTISAAAFNNISINKSAGLLSLAGNITIGGNALVTAGTLDLNTYSFNHASPGGTFSLNSGATMQLAGAGNFPTLFTTYNLAATSLVHYNGTAAQSVAGQEYGHLQFSNGGVKTLAASAIAKGDLTINSGAQFNGTGYALTLNGNWTNSGTFTPGNGDVLLNGSGKTVNGNTTFNDLTVNGSYTVMGSNITYNGFLWVSATGEYAAGSGTATVNGDLTNNGMLTSNGTTTFTGTALQTLRLVNALVSTSTGIVNFNGNVSPVLNSTSTPTFATLNINNTAGVDPSVGWRVLGPFTVSSGSSFDGGVSTHIFSNAFTNNGTVTSTGSIVFNSSTPVSINLGSGFNSSNQVIFGGTGQLTIAGIPAALEDVIIANTNPAGIAPPSGWTMGGKFSIYANSIFQAGGYTYTVNGDLESNGTLNGGTSTFRMTSAPGTLTGSPNTTFYHFTVQGDVTSASDFNVAGNFTNNGIYDGSIGALIMTGNADAIVTGTTTPSTIAQLTINKAATATVTANVDISDVVNLNVAGGTFFTSTRNIAQDASGGVLIVAANATLKLGGDNNTIPAFTGGYGLDEASTVDYAGNTQTVSNTPIYGNLKISAAGNKTTANAFPLTVLGDFTLSAGNFIANNNTHKFAGDWTMTGGTFTATASTILLNGFDDQLVTTIAPFNNFTINKPIGLATLGSNVSVNGILAFTLGKFNIANYNLTLPAGASITGNTPAKYVIAEGSGSLVQQVINGSSKVFPVGTAAFYTPATVALSAGSTTDNFRLRIMPAVYRNATTGTQTTSGVTNATWVVGEDVAGGSTATLSVQWPGLLELPGFQRNICMLVRYLGPNWDVTSTAAATGSNPYTTSRGNLSNFGYFTVATEDVLPVTWVSVTGKAEGERNRITWQVAAEYNNSHYVVEASADGRLFTALGNVAYNTSAQGQYTYLHNGLKTTLNYYRIKQVDVNDHFSYSSTVKVNSSVANEPFVFAPNPVQNMGTLQVQPNTSEKATLRLYSASGGLVLKQDVTLQNGTNAIQLDLSKQAAGVYILELLSNNGIKQSVRLTKHN